VNQATDFVQTIRQRPPAISAIMPAFNAGTTIAAAIASVRHQTADDWELIVVDDGSTDDTLAEAHRAAGSDPRVRIITGPHRGRAVARNVCLDEAQGALIAICDSDDISLPHRFERERTYLSEHRDVHMVSSARVICWAVDSADAFAINGPASDEDIHRTFTRRRMPIFFASAMMRAAIFQQHGVFDEELRRNQDYGFLSRIHESLRFGTIPESMILYRTKGLTTDLATVTENNMFRYVANRRASGDRRSAAELRSTWVAAAYNRLVIPAQYAWYVISRRLLRRGIAALTIDEARMLAENQRLVTGAQSLT
jgi:glycosyltransferase involved in cell wall biosynthesis